MAGHKQNKRQVGLWGEAYAAQYLRKQGYVILCQQWHCRMGEIDIIARDRGNTIVFYEVKTRSTDYWMPIEAAIDQRKLDTLTACIDIFRSEHAWHGTVRLDLICIIRSRPMRLRHYHNLFLW